MASTVLCIHNALSIFVCYVFFLLFQIDSSFGSYFPYTEDACVHDCIYHHLLQDCPCSLVPNDDLTVPVCTVYDVVFHCNVLGRNLEYRMGQLHCDCPLRCRRHSYKTDISTMKFPDNFTVNAMSQYGVQASDYEDFKSNVVSLRLFFNSMKMEVTTQKPAMVAFQLFSQIGGLLGLFIGASMMTILEFLDFAVVLLLEKLRSKTQKLHVVAGTNQNAC